MYKGIMVSGLVMYSVANDMTNKGATFTWSPSGNNDMALSMTTLNNP